MVASIDVVESFVALVEANQYLQAVDKFYAPHAVVRENKSVVRHGKVEILDHERQFLERVDSISCRCIRPILTDGPHVAIHWLFEITLKVGVSFELDEIAYQVWEGELIAEELFYYDPYQLAPTSVRN